MSDQEREIAPERVVEELGSQLRRLNRQQPRASKRLTKGLLASRRALRNAMLTREILGRPVGLRQPGGDEEEGERG